MIDTPDAPAAFRPRSGGRARSAARRLALAVLTLGLPALARAQLGDKLSEGPQVPLPAARNMAVELPLTPDGEQRTFQLPHGFRAELVAAEPMVHDPVAAAYDLEGNLWVVEMSQYNAGLIVDHSPLADGNTATPPSKIVKLESTRHDGRYDR